MSSLDDDDDDDDDEVVVVVVVVVVSSRRKSFISLSLSLSRARARSLSRNIARFNKRLRCLSLKSPKRSLCSERRNRETGVTLKQERVKRVACDECLTSSRSEIFRRRSYLKKTQKSAREKKKNQKNKKKAPLLAFLLFFCSSGFSLSLSLLKRCLSLCL